jgi:hypothetical protein
MMKVLSIVMGGVLTMASVGLGLLCRSETGSVVVPEAQRVITDSKFQALEVAAPPEEAFERMSEIAAASVIEEVVQAPDFKPVQTLEERGDAMLFEAQALLDTPFNQSITMPFDNL